VFRAVVFDLWNTLAFWPEEESRELRRRWAALLEVDAEAIDELWYAPGAYERRESGPITDALSSVHASLGVNGDVAAVLEWRLEVTRRALVPITGVVEILGELRARGLRLGLISNCTEEVALVWDESPFAELFDVAVFSATAGCMKPDRRIYERMLAELGVPASATLFVGDGANDELEGARRVGMTPVLVRRNEGAPLWDGLESWDGRAITSISDVLDLVS
jgi:putative hydrolase of the HAD superfamily